VGGFVHRRPGAALGFSLRGSTFLISLFDVLGLTFLLAGVCAFVATWHEKLLVKQPPDSGAKRVPITPDCRSRGKIGTIDSVAIHNVLLAGGHGALITE
jgi:hypothetical protein